MRTSRFVRVVHLSVESAAPPFACPKASFVSSLCRSFVFSFFLYVFVLSFFIYLCSVVFRSFVRSFDIAFVIPIFVWGLCKVWALSGYPNQPGTRCALR